MGYILCDWHEVYVILHELRIKSGLLKKKVLLTLVVRRHNIRSQRTSCTVNISKKTKIFYLPAKISAHLLTWCDFTIFFKQLSSLKHIYSISVSGDWMHFIFKICQTVANIIMIGQFYEFFLIYFIFGGILRIINFYVLQANFLYSTFLKASFLFYWLTKCFAQVF